MKRAAVRLYVVRHGETNANRTGIVQGHLDVPLNDLGQAQASALGDGLSHAGVHFVKAWSSDLRRAAETAEKVLERVEGGRKLDLIRSEQLRERHMGALQSHPLPRPIPPHVISTLEPTATFRARLLDWWESVLVPYVSGLLHWQEDQRKLEGQDVDEPHNILVVSHGGAITTLIRALSSSSRLHYHDSTDPEAVSIQNTTPVTNCSITLLEFHLDPDNPSRSHIHKPKHRGSKAKSETTTALCATLLAYADPSYLQAGLALLPDHIPELDTPTTKENVDEVRI